MLADPRTRYRLITAGLFGTALVILAVMLAAPSAIAARQAVEAIAGLVVLLIPGFGIAWALRPVGEIRPMELVLAGAAVSIGLVAVGGIALNIVPLSMTRWTWLALVALVLGAVWAFAADREPGSTRLPRLRSLEVRQAAMLGGGVVLALSSIVVARVGAAGSDESFTQLWLLRTPAAGVSGRIGVQSREQDPTGYRVVLLVGGSQVQTWSIQLDPGAEWSADVTRTVPANVLLTVRLFRDTDPGTVYRQTTLWGPVAPPTSGQGSG